MLSSSFVVILDREIVRMGITRAKLLKDLGLNSNSIVNWLNRNSIPSGDVLINLARYFNVSTDYLLGMTDNPSVHKASDSPEQYSDEERQIITDYRSVNRQGQEKIIEYIGDIVTNEKYKKSNQHGLVDKQA